jgi:hypothetical protein
MTIEVGWTALTHIAAWVRSARAAAKDRKQQRFAHIVEHAGVIVAGFRQLNARANRLLLPLAYFYPVAWSDEKRQQWADDLIMFAHDVVILPRMRTSIAALRGLIPEIEDHDTYDVAFEILSVSVSLFSPDSSPHSIFPDEGEILFTDSVGKVLGNAESVFDPDAYIQDQLPELISLLRTATEEPEAGRLREMSKALLGGGGPRPGIRNLSAPTEPSRSAIAPYAEYLQSLFGSLLTQQTRLFPALPSPDWVWID